MPDTARTPCLVATLPAEPTQFDLELAYVQRGAEIVACDARRDLAVRTHDSEHADEAAWLKAQRPSLWLRLIGADR